MLYTIKYTSLFWLSFKADISLLLASSMLCYITTANRACTCKLDRKMTIWNHIFIKQNTGHKWEGGGGVESELSAKLKTTSTHEWLKEWTKRNAITAQKTGTHGVPHCQDPGRASNCWMSLASKQENPAWIYHTGWANKQYRKSG